MQHSGLPRFLTDGDHVPTSLWKIDNPGNRTDAFVTEMSPLAEPDRACLMWGARVQQSEVRIGSLSGPAR
ncbi:hypothetical protein CRM90_06385 [Mycobacterium sp. ENV421]|nr:hypothetical protein CRM90_06385 [Mycobacterium sp. ENV421]